MKLRSNRQTTPEASVQLKPRKMNADASAATDSKDDANQQVKEEMGGANQPSFASSSEVSMSEGVKHDQETTSYLSWGVTRRILHLNIFLYAFCFWMQMGVLPYLTKNLGMDLVVFGYLQTFYNFIQLMGTPVYGRFGDLYGGRAALTLAFAMAACMYGLLGMATTSAFVFLSRVPALFLSANHGTQMVIADVTDESQRAGAMGRLRLSYGVGMIIGPLVGGLVTKYYNEQQAALLSCIGSLASVVLVQLFVPAQTKRIIPAKIQEEKSQSGIFSIEKYVTLVTQTPGAPYFLIIIMVSALPSALLNSMLPMVLMETFKLDPEHNGYMLSGLAVIGMIVQGLLVGPLTKRFSDMALLKASAVLLIVAFSLLALAQDIVHVVLVMLPLTCGNSVISIILNTVMTKIVSTTDTGTMLGLGNAGWSLVGIFAPTIGAILMSWCGFYSFGIIGMLVNVLLLIILNRK